MVSSIIRDLFSEDYDRIVVDDPKVHRNVKNYVQAVAPQMAANVVLHKSKEHVFRTYKIERDVRAAFETRVPLPGGGYLFIEHTEAMHVVDVNSGRAGRGLSQEENSLRVNVESAKEIAKQLRLRDLGGIICVDFIDMRSHSARQKVYDELKKQFRKDRAVTKLLPMSDFGVVEITRQRLRPSITTTTNVDDLPPLEDLPLPEPQQAAAPAAAPEPAGPAPTATEVMEKLERWLSTYRAEVQEQHRRRPILLRVHPFLAAYLDRGIPSTLTRWRFRTRLKFRLDVDEAADPLGFAVLDEKSGKNLTRKYDADRREDA
jgi:ribonuclease G